MTTLLRFSLGESHLETGTPPQCWRSRQKRSTGYERHGGCSRKGQTQGDASGGTACEEIAFAEVMLGRKQEEKGEKVDELPTPGSTHTHTHTHTLSWQQQKGHLVLKSGYPHPVRTMHGTSSKIRSSTSLWNTVADSKPPSRPVRRTNNTEAHKGGGCDEWEDHNNKMEIVSLCRNEDLLPSPQPARTWRQNNPSAETPLL